MNFPRVINIELSTRCNLACTFCDRPALAAKIRVGDMSHSLLSKVLGECRAHGRRIYELGLVGLGEPTLDRELPDHLALVDRYKDCFERISINSNLIGLTAETAQLLLASGINVYTFSLNASTPELYERLCGKRGFDTALAHLNAFVRLALETGSPAGIFVQLMDHSENDSAALHQYLERPVIERIDRVFIRSVYAKPALDSSREALRVKRVTPRHRHPCWSIYSRVYIDLDGRLYPCTIGNDTHRRGSGLDLGSLQEKRLSEIFNGPGLTEARAAAENGRLPFPECADCNVWHLMPNNFKWNPATTSWQAVGRLDRLF